MVSADAGQKMVDQRGDVFLALAQRSQTNIDNVQTEVKVASEAALLHFLSQIAIGGRDNAEVRPPGDERTDRTKFLLLQNPEQLGLQVQRQLADFIEKRGAPVGRLYQAHLGVGGAGEGSLDMPEQFAFHERANHGGAIDGYKGLLGGSHGMDGARDHFLARPRFAQQQRRPAALAELVDQP